MAVSKILIIDDHYEVQDFLRSLLELASDDFHVESVPSAEEGWLELLRVRFDLLITDLRLPGMSGFDLIRMAQKRFPALPIILISGTDSADHRREAQALNVRLFGKPLDTMLLMQAVEEALGAPAGAPLPPVVDAAVAAAEPVRGLPELPPAIVQRINTLLAETSAEQVLLATIAGEVRHSSGRATGLPLPPIVANACSVTAHAMQLGAYLAPDGPATLQFHRGTTYDLYSASVGEQFVLLALVRSQTRRARVGTMWVFIQRAVNDILAQFAAIAAAEEALVANDRSDLAITRPLPADAGGGTPPSDAPDEQEAAADDPPDSGAADDEALDALHALLAEPEEEVRTALDDFWDTAVEDSLATEHDGDGLSLDEARRQGLLPADFGPEAGDA